MKTPREALLMVFEIIKEAFDIDEGCGKCDSCQNNFVIHCSHIKAVAEFISQTKISKDEFVSASNEFKKLHCLGQQQKGNVISLDPSDN